MIRVLFFDIDVQPGCIDVSQIPFSLDLSLSFVSFSFSSRDIPQCGRACVFLFTFDTLVEKQNSKCSRSFVSTFSSSSSSFCLCQNGRQMPGSIIAANESKFFAIYVYFSTISTYDLSGSIRTPATSDSHLCLSTVMNSSLLIFCCVCTFFVSHTFSLFISLTLTLTPWI